MKHPEWANAEIGKSRDKSSCAGPERRGDGEWQPNGYVVSFSSDGIIQNWIVVMAAQHFEYTTSY